MLESHPSSAPTVYTDPYMLRLHPITLPLSTCSYTSYTCRQPSSSSHGKVPKQAKREKKVMTLVEKIQLLDKLRSGQSVAACGHEYGINEFLIMIDNCPGYPEALKDANKNAKVIFLPKNKTALL
ncbi:hypothetical protein Hamer_G016488 [Homarus americanus]|uniref:HTH psq-type domain-containing protein n=1 Tax=Homarus americanus TaxID=6706 RepID=A0A8J5MPM4_HOMAM|nr:hypothetical protein Hamer_G016488 [Homarus americanus]